MEKIFQEKEEIAAGSYRSLLFLNGSLVYGILIHPTASNWTFDCVLWDILYGVLSNAVLLKLQCRLMLKRQLCDF